MRRRCGTTSPIVPLCDLPPSLWERESALGEACGTGTRAADPTVAQHFGAVVDGKRRGLLRVGSVQGNDGGAWGERLQCASLSGTDGRRDVSAGSGNGTTWRRSHRPPAAKSAKSAATANGSAAAEELATPETELMRNIAMCTSPCARAWRRGVHGGAASCGEDACYLDPCAGDPAAAGAVLIPQRTRLAPAAGRGGPSPYINLGLGIVALERVVMVEAEMHVDMEMETQLEVRTVLEVQIGGFVMVFVMA